jgi:CTP:molybdopterin cytidylyltransferase MocA
VVVELGTVVGLVLAAGSGRRIGVPKALLRHDGVTLVEHAMRTLADAGCEPVIVVLGAGADGVRERADLAAATVHVNQAWSTGVGSSLRAGLTAAAKTEAEAVLVVPVDMPGLTVEALQRVADLPHRGALVCATFDGRRSYPMLLGRSHWSGISTLARADVGVRPYLLARAGEVAEVACDDVARADDLDTPEDAASWGIAVPTGA